MTLTPEPKAPTVYTPELANAALPYVRAVVEDIVESFGRLRAADSLRARLERGDSEPVPADVSRETALADAERDRMTARRDVQRALGELERTGVELKDPRRGLVDFPGELEGRPVLLCWMRGEASVAHWHDVEAGFEGRRPLPVAAAAAPADASADAGEIRGTEAVGGGGPPASRGRAPARRRRP